ncbi:MAG: Unknown protein [uncultured Thiotrichaceae bacterium]|uniref:Uncharacterized protein n=1 Tax=uncultured Thiotrichaceae bacterium TaxID=298394 RepID=A0A6S6TSU5_9GAMM|nr:MAG: Unknown protein [uncultured Thiotrichaceae bacterium]
MKNFFPILIGIVVFAGVVLTFSPFVMNFIFPVDESKPQIAISDRARVALADWFSVDPNKMDTVQAYRETDQTSGKQSMYFSYSTDPDTVRGFIKKKGLEQQALTDEVMQEIFVKSSVSWWQPAALNRETWFSGNDGAAELNLIYNAENKRGVLVIIK